MQIQFEYRGLNLTGNCHYEPVREGRQTGHPDTWTENEGGEFSLDTLKLGEHDLSFMLESDLLIAIEDAAFETLTQEVNHVHRR